MIPITMACWSWVRSLQKSRNNDESLHRNGKIRETLQQNRYRRRSTSYQISDSSRLGSGHHAIPPASQSIDLYGYRFRQPTAIHLWESIRTQTGTTKPLQRQTLAMAGATASVWRGLILYNLWHKLNNTAHHCATGAVPRSTSEVTAEVGATTRFRPPPPSPTGRSRASPDALFAWCSGIPEDYLAPKSWQEPPNLRLLI